MRTRQPPAASVLGFLLIIAFALAGGRLTTASSSHSESVYAYDAPATVGSVARKPVHASTAATAITAPTDTGRVEASIGIPGARTSPGPVRVVSDCCRAAKAEEDAGEIVYRVHGGESGPHGHSWTPEDPATLGNPRSELGLPDVNSGEFLTKARVKDWTGVAGRRALPLDGNPGGAPEYLFPNPLEQLEHIETRRVRPPY